MAGTLSLPVSGMKAQANKLQLIAHDVTQSGTNGAKRRGMNFSGVVSGLNGTGGVQTHARHHINEQGSVTGTNSSTDMAITGGGFFVVSKGEGIGATEQFFYTRDGGAIKNKNGVLESAAGYIYRGWAVDETGEPITTDTGSLTELVPINLKNVTGSVKATSSVKHVLNLQPKLTNDASYSSNINIVDSQGNEHNLKLNWAQTGVNAWSLSIDNPTGGTVTKGTGGAYTNVPLTFDGSGYPLTYDGGASMPTIEVAWTNGADANSVALNLGDIGKNTGITQQGGTLSGVKYTNTDGQVLGVNTGFTVSQDGLVTAEFSNGTTKSLYRIPLATFINPDGLRESSGNVYSATDASGGYVLQRAEQGSSGSITGNSIESSTVDLASAVTDLIETQTAYSINAKVVETYKNVFGTLERL